MLYRFPNANRSSLALREGPPRGAYATFADDLRWFIASRLDRIDLFKESAEYARQNDLAQGLHDTLSALLPADGRAKLQEYADALGAAHCLETELLCEQAFLDGVRLAARALSGAPSQ